MIKGLPEKLRELRTQQRLSQRGIAARLGISPSIVSGYETGERTPSTEILLALSYLYNCSTDYLLGRTAPTSPLTVDTSGLTDRQIRALEVLIESMRKP